MILQGAVLYFAGYFSFYLGATATSPTNYLIMGGLMFVAGNGSAATYTSALGAYKPLLPLHLERLSFIRSVRVGRQQPTFPSSQPSIEPRYHKSTTHAACEALASCACRQRLAYLQRLSPSTHAILRTLTY